MLSWRIYYDDESTFDNTQGTPEQAPPRGIIVIAQLNRHTNVIRLHGFDWYWYRSDDSSWYGGDLVGLLDQFMAFPDFAVGMKQGRTVLVFQDIIAKAQNDADFPKKSGRHLMENRKR